VSSKIISGDLEIDLSSRLIRKAGQTLKLSRQQQTLLEMLARNANQTLTYQQLLQEVWGDSYTDDSRYILHNAIKRLREKIGDAYIISESTVGYRFQLQNHPVPEQPPSIETTAPTSRYVPSPNFTNLPSQRTSFVGRDEDKRAIHELLNQPETRLITFTGPGGTGKTRLALEVASGLVNTFTNGTVFVSLASITDKSLVLRAVGQALAIKDTGDYSINTIINLLRDKHLLLILDNFEQVIEAAPYISTLLGNCPLIKVLVTSRAMLQLYGEHEYPVPPLELPDQYTNYVLDALLNFSAIELFVERAQASNRVFCLTNENVQAVIAICARLDGLPLAIELVTARLKYQSPQALWERLKSNTALSILNSGPRDVDTRQQTLRAAIAWSYDLLSAEEQQLFDRIAVFENGYTVDAIHNVCNLAHDLLLDPLEGMIALMDKSLVHFKQDSDGITHFAMLQTIREFAQEQLVTCGEQETLIQKHALYYAALADEAGAKHEDISWLNRLELEHDNIRRALHWFIQVNDAESALKMCSSLWNFWYTRGYFREGRQWIAEAFKIDSVISDETMARSLRAEGMLAMAQGQHAIAVDNLKRTRTIWDAQDNKSELANTLHSLGTIHMSQGDFDTALELFEQTHRMFAEIGNLRGTTVTIQNMGIIAIGRQDFDGAKQHFHAALDIARSANFTLGVVMSLSALGSTAYWDNDYVGAARFYKESLHANQELNDQYGLTLTIESLGLIALDTGKSQISAHLFSAIAKLRESIGLPLDDPKFRQIQEEKIKAAEEQFGEKWSSWWEEGSTMPIEDIIHIIDRHL